MAWIGGVHVRREVGAVGRQVGESLGPVPVHGGRPDPLVLFSRPPAAPEEEEGGVGGVIPWLRLGSPSPALLLES